MSSSSTKRKTRKNGLGELSGSSPEGPTTEVGSLSDRDFEEITSKVERSLGKRLKEQSDVQQEMLKMLNAMQSKFDELSRTQRKLTCPNGGVLEINPSLVGNTIDDENTYVAAMQNWHYSRAGRQISSVYRPPVLRRPIPSY